MLLFKYILGNAVTRKPESECEDEILAVSTHDSRELAIRIFHKNIPEYPRDLFKVSLINTPHIGESQVTAIRFAGKYTKTCGYIFPIASLRTGEYLPEGRWPMIYAAAATREILESEIATHLISDSILGASELEVNDIFPENLGILVLGRQQIEEFSTSIEAVELMLMEYGYVPQSINIKSSSVLGSETPYEARISLRQLANDLADEVLALHWLMGYRYMQKTMTGIFLTLYQIIECVLSRVFGIAMEHMISDPRSRRDPWWVREMVQQIQTDKWRLNLIKQHCMRSNIPHNSFSDNSTACEKLLLDLKFREANSKELPWSGALYRIRNIFVHNQAVLREADDHLLLEVCETLQQVCFVIMGGYSDPSPDCLK